MPEKPNTAKPTAPTWRAEFRIEIFGGTQDLPELTDGLQEELEDGLHNVVAEILERKVPNWRAKMAWMVIPLLQSPHGK